MTALSRITPDPVALAMEELSETVGVLWTRLPEAAALLREAAASPPETRVALYDFGETAVLYKGSIARQLRKIRDDHMEAISDAKPFDADAFNANCLLTVEIAVSAAVEDAKARAAVANDDSPEVDRLAVRL